MSKMTKNYIVMGQTGVGKSTLIDAYINYLTGVDYYDKFRFKLIDERAELSGRDKDSQQAASVTSKVTIYHIPSKWIKKAGLKEKHDEPYCINLVDTPGFGDTRGSEVDSGIFTMIGQMI